MRYTVTYGYAPQEEGYATAIVEVPARIIGEHFAIRFFYDPHPAGEGLHTEVAQLEHMPSGLCVFPRAGVGAPEACCEAMGKSLGSMPVDWSKEVIPAPESSVFRAFAQKAWEEAENGEASIDYGDWLLGLAEADAHPCIDDPDDPAEIQV